MEEGELSDDGLEYIISDDENEKVEQVARRIQALEQKNKEIELIEIFSTFGKNICASLDHPC